MSKRYYLRAAYLLVIVLVVLLTACSSNQSGQTSSSSSSGQTSQPSQPSIVGTWTGGCSLTGNSGTTEFRDDGTSLLGSTVVNYTLNGNQVQFSSNQGTVEYSYWISSSGNVLHLSDTQGHFCLMPRAGSSGVQEIRSSLAGTWTGDCLPPEANTGIPEFHRAVFRTDGTLTLDSDNYTYTIPGVLPANPVPDYTTVDFASSEVGPVHYTWEISEDGKTLTLTSIGSSPCSLTRS